MWTCDVCGREFKRRNQSHFCKTPVTTDDYIAQFSSEDQNNLKKLREIITSTAPFAKEKISWEMPTYVQNGNLVHFAMHKNRIGFYVGKSTVQEFEKELLNFRYDKGTIHLPKNQALPTELIKKIVQFNIEKNEMKK